MKQTLNLNKLHLGSMIREIALAKGIPSKILAGLILRYQQNSNKIYQQHDMDVEDVILISYLLEYNFLKMISDKYLSHLPPIKNHPEQEIYQIEWNMQTGHLSVIRDIKTHDALQKIHIGQYIEKLTKKRGWNGRYMADLLGCTQGNISDLYTRKGVTIKTMIQISAALKHNLIADVYLSRMFMISSPTKFANCIMTITPQEIRIENSGDKTFPMIYCRKHDEK